MSSDESGEALVPESATRPATLSRPETLSRPDAFAESTFWRKLSRFAGRIGRGGVAQALTLYYAMRDPDTPRRAKATIAGVLGYLIVPLDVVPDVLIGVGYGDDMMAIAFAAGIVAMHVKKEHRQAAEARLEAWFARRGRSARTSGPGAPGLDAPGPGAGARLEERSPDGARQSQ